MDTHDFILPVRIRAVVEMSFPGASRYDPSDYDKLIEQCKRTLEQSPIFHCTDVAIRDFMTICLTPDDYEKWRDRHLADLPPGLRITTRAR